MSDNIFDGIKIPKRILKITGHWPESSTTWSNIRGLISLLIAIVFVISLVMEVAKHFHDYQILTAHLAISVPPISFMFKLILFKSENRQFLTLLKRLNLEVFSNYPKNLEGVMKTYIKTSVTIGIIYQWICYTVVVLYCFLPFLTKVDLPIRFSYDLGSFKRLMYIFQVFGLANAVTVNACLDILAMGLMGMASVQLDILNQNIINFKSKSNKDQEIHIFNLKKCVIHHTEIIRYVKNLERAFSMTFLVQYLTSAAVICNIGFQLAHVQPMSVEFAHMLVFFAAMMCQWGMYCWYGNEILIKSAATKNACYNSQWLNCNIKVRKLLIIITERSKRPLFLTAGKFSVLSLTSFASVINTSYSYFALMQRLYRKTQS